MERIFHLCRLTISPSRFSLNNTELNTDIGTLLVERFSNKYMNFGIPTIVKGLPILRPAIISFVIVVF